MKLNYKKYLNKFVFVGVPNIYETNRLFWNFGILTEIGEDCIGIRTKTGETIYIDFKDILRFRCSGSQAINEWRYQYYF